LIDQYVITAPLAVTGVDAGAKPQIKVFNLNNNQVVFDKLVYEASFLGGVRVATGDVNGDGGPDFIVAPGPGRAPLVKVFDAVTGNPVASFLAYGMNFQAGVNVAAGNLDGQPGDEIIVGPERGKQPVKVFNRFGALLFSFFPYGPNFRGGVRVAAGNVEDSQGGVEIITAPAHNHTEVKVFNNNGTVELVQFVVGNGSISGGLFVAAGDVNGDGLAEIITGNGAGATSRVRVFDGDGGQMDSFVAYAGFRGGVRVGVVDLLGDGQLDILTAPGAGAAPRVNAFDGLNFTLLDSFLAYEALFINGLFVAGG
jgi:hypothetical protein